MANKARIFLNKMIETLDDINTTLLSDSDLFYLVNSQLDKENRITLRYFEYLKGNQDHEKSISQNSTLTEVEKEDFISALRVGRIKQKMNLTANALNDETKNAYPRLWMLERKNTNLQLKQQVEVNHNPIIHITASNDDDKRLIEDILNDDGKIEMSYTDYDIVKNNEKIDANVISESI